MLAHRNVHTLRLLLLLHVSGCFSTKFNLFRRNPKQQEGDMRLSGSESLSEGRVEVYHDGKWGTGCDDSWDMAEAQVVCRQLRFPGAKSVVIGKNYGEASGPIWLDDINCKGTENHLFTCGFKSWGVTDCTHKEDVGVICETASNNVTISDSTHVLDHTFSLSDDLGQMFDSGNGCDLQILVRSATETDRRMGQCPVVPDEYFLLQTVESWITDKGNSVSLETQADLLNRLRFPMIPAEKLYELESNSSLYSTHKQIYDENMLKAFQFNVLLFSNLLSNPNFDKDDDDYQPRIYTATPWSTAIGSPSVSSYKHFCTPIHNSLIFKHNEINWEANVFMKQYECSNQGVRCKPLPVTRLIARNQLPQQSNILFRNWLLVGWLLCQGKYICQVQDFKLNLAHIAENGTQVLPYPCPDDQYVLRL